MKKLKNKNKSQQEKFEERIRCNNTIIQKIVDLGKKFRKQELEIKQEKDNLAKLKRQIMEEMEEEQDIEKGERLRDRKERLRQKERQIEQKLDRTSGRGRQRDR